MPLTPPTPTVNTVRDVGFTPPSFERVAADEDQRKQLRPAFSRERATRLEGSFGTRKQHYSLDKIKARIKENEILWIFFGIHTANAVKMIEKVQEREEEGRLTIMT